MLKISVRDSGAIDLPGDLRPVLDDIARQWTAEVVARTRSGRDADGKTMRPRRDGTRATLHDSGAMLASLQADVGDRGFKIAPAGRRNVIVAAVHQATGRRWAGASEDQIEDARAAVVEALQGKK